MFSTLLLALTLGLFQLALPVPTGNNATIILTAEARAGLASGDTLIASNTEGTVVGYGEIPAASEAMAMALWEDNMFTPYVDGYVDGEPLRFGTWDGEVYRPYLVGQYDEWTTPGLTKLVGLYEQDAFFFTSHLLLSGNTVGFTQPTITVAQGAEISADVAVLFEGPGQLAGLQVDIGSGVQPVSLLPSGWSIVTAPLTEDSTRFLATNVDAPLSAGSHNLFRLTFTPSESGTIELGNPIGGLSGQAGEDAGLSLGAGTLTYTLIPRGDANGDNRADIGDLVYAIDAALNEQPFHPAIDLHPFPSGNGEIDVRDVLVVAEALVSGQWPDGLPVLDGGHRALEVEAVQLEALSLKAESAPKRGGNAAARGADGAATLVMYHEGNKTYLTTDVPLRALQGRLVAYDDSLMAIPQASLVDDTSSEDYSFLFYRMGTEPMEAPFGVASGHLDPEDFADLTGVTADGQTVEVTVSFTVSNEEGSPQAEQPLTLYPNPTRGSVTLSKAASGTMYDVLGRRILEFEDATSLDLAPYGMGLYIVVIDGKTHRVTVVR